MVRFDERIGYFVFIDFGRIVSYFYIKYDIVEVWLYYCCLFVCLFIRMISKRILLYLMCL